MLFASSWPFLREIRDEIRGRLTVPWEQRFPAVELKVFLERLDATADDPRVGGEGPGHVTRPMACVAPPRIQRPAPLHARGERAEPLGKHRLAGTHSRRARNLGALAARYAVIVAAARRGSLRR